MEALIESRIYHSASLGDEGVRVIDHQEVPDGEVSGNIYLESQKVRMESEGGKKRGGQKSVRKDTGAEDTQLRR